jgi:hypothetical protein
MHRSIRYKTTKTGLTTIAEPDLIRALSCLEFGIGWLMPGK